VNKTNMALPDLFFMELVKIPAFFERLNGLKTQQTYKETSEDITSKMRKLTGAF
jgi:hypothetical protein